MALELTYLNPPDVPVEVEGVTPDRLQQMGLDEIRKLPVFVGNEEAPLGDLFRVSGDPTDGCHRWHGDLTGVHWIGAKMRHVHAVRTRHLDRTRRQFGHLGDWGLLLRH